MELVLDRNAEIHLDYVDVRTKAGLFGRIRHVKLLTSNIQDGRFQNLFPNDRKGNGQIDFNNINVLCVSTDHQ